MTEDKPTVEPRFHPPRSSLPGLELSQHLRHEPVSVTRQEALVQKAIRGVVRDALTHKHPDVMWVEAESEGQRYDMAAEYIGRSTAVGDTGSSGSGFGFNPSSDREVIIYSTSKLSTQIGDSYGKQLKDRFGLHVDTTHIPVITTGPVFSPSTADTIQITDMGLRERFHNPGTVTKVMMTNLIWGDEKLFAGVKRSLTSDDLFRVGLYAALVEVPWMVRAGVTTDPIKYGMGGNRAILHCLNMASSLLSDRDFFTHPKEMSAKMTEAELISPTQGDQLLKAMSDYVICRTLNSQSHIQQGSLYSWSDIESYIPPEFKDHTQIARLVRQDRKHVLQIYYQLKNRFLDHVGFSGRTGVEYKSWPLDKQIDYVLNEPDAGSRQQRLTAAIWLTRDIDVIRQLYLSQGQPSWMTGFGVVKFRPPRVPDVSRRQHQAEVHASLIQKVQDDNSQFWRNEPYLASTSQKTVSHLGYAV